MAAVLNFIQNKMLKYPLATQLNRAYLKNQMQTPKSWSSFNFIDIIKAIYCFDPAKMAAILDFTHNAITKVRSGHTLCQTCLETLWYTPKSVSILSKIF